VNSFTRLLVLAAPLFALFLSGCPTKEEDPEANSRMKSAEGYYEGPNAYPYDDEEGSDD
jgi:hypothetical protein